MTLGKRKPRQNSLWVDTRHWPAHAAHPFYRRLDEILQRARFDLDVERLGRKDYAPTMGRPSLAPGICFRYFLVGYFEGIDSERGITCRIADWLRCGSFWGLSLEEPTPHHSMRSQIRRRSSLGTHETVFRWPVRRLAREGLLSGKNPRVDAATRQAHAALKAIGRRDNGAGYDESVAPLMPNDAG